MRTDQVQTVRDTFQSILRADYISISDIKQLESLNDYYVDFFNGLKPYLYLTYVLERLRQLGPFPKSEELDSLLPWAEELPEEIETKTKPKK